VTTLKLQICVGSYFNFLPFQWETSNTRIHHQLVLSMKTGGQSLICKFWKVLTWINGTIILARLIHSCKAGRLKMEDGTGLLHIMWTTVYIFLCIVYHHVTSKASEFCQVTNNFMRLVQTPRKKYVKGKIKF